MNFKKVFGQNADLSGPARRDGEERRVDSDNIRQNRRSGTDRRASMQDADKTKMIEKYKRISLFRGLSTDQILQLLRICSKQKFSTLKYIYRRGTKPESLFIVLKGTLHSMLRIDEVWFAIEPMDCAGEMEFFTGSPRAADVIAAEETIVLRISRAEAQKVFERDKDLYARLLLNVIHELYVKLINDTEEIEKLHYRLRSLDTI